MSMVIKNHQLGKTKFRKGDLVYYINCDKEKRYGIVEFIEFQEKGDAKVWAYWQNEDTKIFQPGHRHSTWGSGFMFERSCYMEPDRSLVLGWENLPEFYKI